MTKCLGAAGPATLDMVGFMSGGAAASLQPTTVMVIEAAARVQRAMRNMVHLRRTLVRHSKSVPRAVEWPYGCPATFTGTRLFASEPSPSSPSRLPPQQYAVPPGVTPQVCHHPTLTSAKVRPPDTCVGALMN